MVAHIQDCLALAIRAGDNPTTAAMPRHKITKIPTAAGIFKLHIYLQEPLLDRKPLTWWKERCSAYLSTCCDEKQIVCCGNTCAMWEDFLQCWTNCHGKKPYKTQQGVQNAVSEHKHGLPSCHIHVHKSFCSCYLRLRMMGWKKPCGSLPLRDRSFRCFEHFKCLFSFLLLCMQNKIKMSIL